MKTVPLLLSLVVVHLSASRTLAQFESNIVRSFAVSPGGKLTLRADRGAIEIKTGPSTNVSVEVRRSVKVETADQAAELFAGHLCSFDHSANQLVIEAKDTNSTATTTVTSLSSWWSKLFGGAKRTVLTQTRPSLLEVTFVVFVPSRFSIDLHTSAGEVVVADLEGEARVDNSSGSIRLGRIKGPVVAQTHGGHLHLLSCEQNLEAATSSGNIELGEINAPAKLRTYGGRIKAAKVSQSLEAASSSGDIILDEIGPARLKTYGGSITVKHGRGSFSGETSSGHLTLGDIEGDVSARTSGGNITARRITGKADLNTSSGKVKIGEVDGDVTVQTYGGSVAIQNTKGRVVARTSSGDVKVDRVAGGIDATTFGGDIWAGLTGQPPRDCQLETSSGDIELSLTNSVAVDLRVRASGGDVLVDLPLTELLNAGNKRGALRAKINGGGPVLDLQARGGVVRVKPL